MLTKSNTNSHNDVFYLHDCKNKYSEKNDVETIFAQKWLVNFTNNYKDMAGTTLS